MATSFSIGVDVGSHAVKVARLKQTKKGVAVTGLACAPLEGLAGEAPGERRNQRVGLLVRDLLRSSGIRGKYAVTAIPGKRLFFRYVHVPPVPAFRLKALMEYEIEEEGGEDQGEVSYDYRLLQLPTRSQEFTVLVTMAKNEATEEAIQTINRSGLRTKDIYPGAVALFNAYRMAHPGDIEETSVLLNIGAENVDMIIQDHGSFFFTRCLTNGGNTFTKALAEELEVSLEEAEQIKISQGKILPIDADYDEDNPTREMKISDALASAADGLANAIQSSVMYARAQLKLTALQLERVQICGGGSLLPGLSEYLGTRLRMDTEILNPFENIDTSSLSSTERKYVEERPGLFTDSVGLALTDFQRPNSIVMSLLPEREKKKRNFQLTDKYLWYGAACLIVALILSLYTSKKMDDALSAKQDALQTIRKKAESRNKDIESRRQMVDRQVGKVDALLLRAHSATEVFQLLKVLTNQRILPSEMNLTKVQIEAMDPLAVRVTEEAVLSPSERRVRISGLVRTAVPPPIIIPADGKAPPKKEPPPENYKKGLEIIRKFTDTLEEQEDVIYKATLTRANADPEREKLGMPLEFSVLIELVPKTDEGRQLMEDQDAAAEISSVP